jgi:hypothetical protein
MRAVAGAGDEFALDGVSRTRFIVHKHSVATRHPIKPSGAPQGRIETK